MRQDVTAGIGPPITVEWLTFRRTARRNGQTDDTVGHGFEPEADRSLCGYVLRERTDGVADRELTRCGLCVRVGTRAYRTREADRRAWSHLLTLVHGGEFAAWLQRPDLELPWAAARELEEAAAYVTQRLAGGVR